MRTKIKRILFRIAYLSIVGIVLYATVINPAAFNAYIAKHTFKEGVRTLDGTPVMSLDDATDELVVVTIYWSTKCKYCHQMLLELEVISDHVIAINVRDSEAAVKKYVEENNLTCTVLLGMPQPPSTGLPHTQLLVNVEGEWALVNEWMGYVPVEEITSAVSVVEEILKEVENEN